MARIKHYGTPRRSGRYPWGSGKDPYQSGGDFLSYVKEMQDKGMSDSEIAKSLGISRTRLQARKTLVRAEQRAADRAFALRLKDKGMSNTAIGERMGINESSVRSLLDPALHDRSQATLTTADMIRKSVDGQTYIDIGAGTEQHLGVSRARMNQAVEMLRDEGYEVQYMKVQQVGTGKYTTIKVLAKPDADYVGSGDNREKIGMVDGYSEDGGRTFREIQPYKHIDSDRIMVRYGPEGGAERDGTIELRPGVDDLSLGDSRYAQVRVGVDGKYYMKGMAMYGKDFPKGVDIIYNTNKERGSDPYAAFKTLDDDPDSPFGGSTVRQKYYIDADGNERLSPLNIIGSKPGTGLEGSWDEWSRTLSSQVLSKQTPKLAQRQLDLALKLKNDEFDEIMSLTNPTVRRKLLETFADQADSDAVHLKGAALPRQSTKVLLPIESMSSKEVYAPTYRNGEQVVLIRHPHGGIFEIPQLTVNNRHPEAKSLLGRAKDAIGINSEVAQKLSGADFDGDSVIVIPNKHKFIKTAPTLKALKDFDPISAYPKYDGMPVMSNRTKQLKMGDVSNLITDMTIKGASPDEIARAVKHSMVVIDAEKHQLNYEQSYIDHGIGGLKKKYQGGKTSGASTLISRAKSLLRIDEREEGAYVTDPTTGKMKKLYVDPETGKKLYTKTGDTYVNKDGKVVKVKTKTTKGAVADDLHTLSSGTLVETIYANHGNALKALANKARKTALGIKDIEYSKSASKTFSDAVNSLKAKLGLAKKNKPLERKAQLIANSLIKKKKKANPNMDPDSLKKLKGRELEKARARVGAKKQNINITDTEWLAIQAGAVSPSFLSSILDNTDIDALKQKALPKTKKLMTPNKKARAKTLANSGYTQAEIADALGVSLTTLKDAIN